MDRGQTEISRLQEQRRALANEKRALTRQLKNESRKRARLLQKSSKLSVPDLVQSLYIRQARAAERERRAEERAAERDAGRSLMRMWQDSRPKMVRNSFLLQPVALLL